MLEWLVFVWYKVKAIVEQDCIETLDKDRYALEQVIRFSCFAGDSSDTAAQVGKEVHIIIIIIIIITH